MTTLPKILLCGIPNFGKEEVRRLFDGIAQLIEDDAPHRAEFFARFRPGGPYHGAVGIYRRHISRERLGDFDRELVEGLPESLKWISQHAAGYDNIDVYACKERGIGVSNTPGEVDDATATTALYLLLAAVRRFPEAERSLRAGTWKGAYDRRNAHDLPARTLGVLGLGGIGLRLAHLARAFPMRVVYHNRRPRADAPEWAEYVGSVEELCREADVLSVHVPLTEETIHLVGEREIRAMKRGGVLVNTARGKVVDEEAMIRALEDGHLSAVGLDVYPDEPHVNPGLLAFPQNTLLPHIGTNTLETEKSMELRAMTNLRDFLVKGTGEDLVPELRPILAAETGRCAGPK